jgi:hypothetical protein
MNTRWKERERDEARETNESLRAVKRGAYSQSPLLLARTLEKAFATILGVRYRERDGKGRAGRV